MQNLSLVPYRNGGPLVPREIDVKLVPDCGRSELARLGKRKEEIKKSVDHQLSEIGNTTFARIFSPALPLSILAGIIVAIGVSDVVGVFVGAFPILAIFVGISAIAASKTEERKRALLEVEHQDETASLTSRIEAINRLENLTGKAVAAARLEWLAEDFNRNLQLLDSATCSAHDLTMIAEKRYALIVRINAFRAKVGGAPFADTNPDYGMMGSDEKLAH